MPGCYVCRACGAALVGSGVGRRCPRSIHRREEVTINPQYNPGQALAGSQESCCTGQIRNNLGLSGGGFCNWGQLEWFSSSAVRPLENIKIS
jgi:hypothetical protein